MGKWITICTICMVALFFPGAELHCWDTAGTRVGTWSETSCDGLTASGRWTGYVTSDCRFIGTGRWETVTGSVDLTSRILSAIGESRDGCGSITISGTLSSDFVSLNGSYNYSQGGGGSFVGRILTKNTNK